MRGIDDKSGLDGADAGLFVGQFVVGGGGGAVVVLGVDFEEVVQHDH